MKKVIIIAIFLFGYQILAGQDLIDNWMIEGETVVTDNINQSTVNAEYCPSTSSYWAQSNRSVFLPIYGSKKFKVKINFIVIQRESASRGNFINDEIYNEIIDGTIGLLNYHYDNLVNVPQESLEVCFDNTIGEIVYSPSIKLEFTGHKIFIPNNDYWGSHTITNSLYNEIYSNNDYNKTLNVFFTMNEQTYDYMVDQNTLDPDPVLVNWVNGFPKYTNMDYNQYITMPNKYA